MKNTKPERFTDEEILDAACEEVLEQDWAAGVQAAVANRLGIAASTIQRRFEKRGGFKRAIIERALATDSHLGSAWTEDLVDLAVPAFAERDSIADGLMAGAKQNWDLVVDDDRMFMHMLLWSRTAVDPMLRTHFKRHYKLGDRLMRTVLQDMLSHMRNTAGRDVRQRPGLTDAQLIVALDAFVEGLLLRSHLDSELDGAEIYGRVLQALTFTFLDFDGDQLSIGEFVDQHLDGSPRD